MKITIECNDAAHTIDTTSDELRVSVVIDYIYLLLHSVGYHPDSIKTAFIDKGDILYSEEEDKEVDKYIAELDKEASEEVQPDEELDIEQPVFEKTVSVNSRYGEQQLFHRLDGVWYFNVSGAYVRVSMSEDKSLSTLSSVDPEGGPYIGVGTCLYDIHSDLPKVSVQRIDYEKKYKMYKLTVATKENK